MGKNTFWGYLSPSISTTLCQVYFCTGREGSVVRTPPSRSSLAERGAGEAAGPEPEPEVEAEAAEARSAVGSEGSRSAEAAVSHLTNVDTASARAPAKLLCLGGGGLVVRLWCRSLVLGHPQKNIATAYSTCIGRHPA